MPVSESMVQDIVKEVVARMQLSGNAGTAQHGVFTDMNQAIEAAKEAEAKVRCMTMDQREQIVSNIRRKTHENAELLARMGVEETGMGNVGDKILKHHLLADKPRNGRYNNDGMVGRQRTYPDRDGALWRYRSHYSLHQSQ